MQSLVLATVVSHKNVNRNLHLKYLNILTKFQMLHFTLVGVLFFNKTYLLQTLLEALTT